VYDAAMLADVDGGEAGTASTGGVADAGGRANATSGANSGATAGSGSASAGKTGESGGVAGTSSTGGGGDGGQLEADAGMGTGGSAMAGSSGAGGSGGTGGSGGGSPCAAHPLTPDASWTPTASSSENGGPPAHVIDGDLSNRWSTGKLQSNADWFQLDFGATVSIDKVTLVLGDNALDYPRAYAVRFSDTANDLNASVLLMGSGKSSTDTVLNFASPVTGQYLLITQSGTASSSFWSIAEIVVACNK
jgi:F5/8 type C domain